jgi:hypothetical protein
MLTVPALRAIRAQARSKHVVKNWLGLICADTIRSLRTKWSRMENKAVVQLVSLLLVSIGWRYDRPAEQGANPWQRKRAS